MQDAHSLYLEKLAELGAIGLVLLLWVLAVPVLAAIRIRGRPFVTGAFGAYVAFAAHAAVDWDWELPAVTFAGIFCGALLIVAARSERAPLVLGGGWRAPCSSRCSRSWHCHSSAWSAIRPRRPRSGDCPRGLGRGSGKARQASTWAPWSAQALVLQADVAFARDEPAVRVRCFVEPCRKIRTTRSSGTASRS